MGFTRSTDKATWVLTIAIFSYMLMTIAYPKKQTDKKLISPACFSVFIQPAANRHPSVNIDSDPCRFAEPTAVDKQMLQQQFRIVRYSPEHFIAIKKVGGWRGKTVYLIKAQLGGSALLTDLSSYHLQRGVLTLTQRIANGDRCQGGIDDAYINHGKLTYTRNMTPRRLLGEKLGLPDCAQCCIGKITYLEQTVAGFEFSPKLNFITKNERYHLFSNIVSQTIAEQGQHLDASELRAFCARVINANKQSNLYANS